MRPIRITPSSGGWLHADWGAGRAWLRLEKDRQDKLTRIAALHMPDPTPERLRDTPLKRIHAAVTMRGAGAVQLALALRINEPPPDLSSRPKDGVRLSQRYRLKRPARRRLDDNFYKDVAHAYQSAVAFGLNPREAIVADTGAADATVAAWVGEARRRDYLPKGRPGKVTA
jgi:hypothetical protein